METEIIEITCSHIKSNVCVTETDCTVEVDFSTTWEEDFNGKRVAVVEDVTITAFVFYGNNSKARLEKGDLGFDYFTGLANMERITATIYERLEDQR